MEVQRRSSRPVSTFEPTELVGSYKADAKFELSSIGDKKVRRFFSCKHLQFEAIRLATFWDWESDAVSATDLARAGFFSLHTKDMVQCHYCTGAIGFWEKGDQPASEHAKHYPSCPLVMGGPMTNVPLDGSSGNTLLQNFVVESLLDGRDLPSRKLSFHTDSVRIGQSSMEPPADHPIQYPQFRDPKKREDSFQKSCVNFPSKKEMAKAGFFSIGLSDMVQCWKCAGGVFNWQSHEDPCAVHDELYPTCSLSHERRGCVDTAPPTGIKRKRPSDRSRQMQVLDLPMAKKLTKMGWDSELISGALWQELENYGFLPVDVNEATDVIADYEDYLDSQGLL